MFIPSVSFVTLGCKLNQVESESLASAFIDANWNVLDSNTSLCIINTCAVTSMAEQKARRVIRSALIGQQCTVLVTGCYAQLNKTDIQAIDDRLFVVGGKDKDELLKLPSFIQSALKIDDALALQDIIKEFVAHLECKEEGARDPFALNTRKFSFHSRSFLKIQDGCNNSCAYCAVQIARGKSISASPAFLLEHLQKLQTDGFNELVLSGVNICMYNYDGMNLSDLIVYLLQNTKHIALRLSSLEPDFIDGQFLEACKNERLRPHFHLSVQSLCDSVLQRMYRKYNAAAVMHAVELLRSVKENPFIAADIITGFCGETDADFEETFSRCKASNFAWIHAFPFSRRPLTMAYNFTDTVPASSATERMKKLSFLAKEGKQKFAAAAIGKSYSAIMLEGGIALSENYLRIALDCPMEKMPKKGASFRCSITKLCRSKADVCGCPKKNQ